MGRKWLKTTFMFIGIIILAIMLRMFFIEIYSIPSGSMEDSLLPGDKIVVNKLIYGSKLPASPYDIPWINLFWFLHAKAMTNLDSVYWNYKRLPGISDFRRGDVMVFSHPLWGGPNNFFIKRCIALPCDTLAIESGNVKINGQSWPEPSFVKKRYKAWINNRQQFTQLTYTLGIRTFSLSTQTYKKGIAELFLTEIQKNQLWESETIDSFKVITLPPDSSLQIFPKIQDLTWTIDDYGPLVIPHEGMLITLTDQSFSLYKSTINLHEKMNLVEKNGLYYLNEKQVTQYVFQQNYYFMLGDNRHNSNDSRYWGFVPEKSIVGKAGLIFYNYHDGKFWWNRLLKRIV